MNIKVGTGPDNWGVWFPQDDKQTPWNRYLDEVVQAGYDLTELGPYGYMPASSEMLRRELDSRGLKLEAGFTFGDFSDSAKWDDLVKETVGAGALASSLGARFHLLIDYPYTNLFTGEPIAPPRLNEDAWKRFVKTVNQLASLVRERFGLTAVFHPHAETHIEYEDQIERFLADTDPNVVSLCLDTGHHAYRGGDPVRFMRKHHARIPYLHLKSVDREMQTKVEREGIPFAKAVEMDMFCEPSKGAVNFEAFRDVLKEIDYEGCAIVEQDMYPAPFNKPLPIAKRTRDYLRRIGIG
jgi:inosose dehydratase